MLVNIETKSAVDCFDEMLQTADISYLSGVVVGRGDLASSMKLPRDKVNGDDLLNISKQVARKAFERGLDFVIGGRVSCESIPFFNHSQKVI